jgi:hypothetical protein
MTHFTDIDTNDIIYFLKKYDQMVGENLYLDAWNLLISNKGIEVPISIADWIIAYNNPKLQHTTYSNILLGKSETFGNLDKSRIIRIYTFAHKLIDDLLTLPPEVINNILSYSDCKTVINACNTSKISCNPDLLQTVIKRDVPINTSEYNNQELKGLCKFINSKHSNYLFMGLNDVVYVTDKYGRMFSLTRDSPRLLPEYKNISDLIFISGDSIMALNNNGEVLISGFAAQKFRLPHVYNISLPRIVPLQEKIKQIAGGRYSLSLSGNIYDYTQKINDTQEYTQIAGSPTYVIATNKNKELFLRGNCNNYNTIQFEKIYGMDDVAFLAGDYSHFLVSKLNGDILFFGNILYVTYNNKSTLNVGNIKDVKKIVACGDYYLIITLQGDLYFFGIRTSDKGRHMTAKKVKKLKIKNVKDAAGAFYGAIVLTYNNKIKEVEKNYILKNLDVVDLQF